MNLYHHQTKRFLYENDRSMRYLLEDSYRTTTYHFVVDDPPPLRVHPDHRIIVKLLISFTFLLRPTYFTDSNITLQNHRYATWWYTTKLHGWPFKTRFSIIAKRIYLENIEKTPAFPWRKPCNDISLCRCWWWTQCYYVPSLPWSISSSSKTIDRHLLFLFHPRWS